jgi:anti-sigma factor ChrR (cupin superfamily)
MPNAGPTSAVCQAQEAQQTELASSTVLPQVKEAALKAAAAWSRQGVDARSREARERERINRAKLAQAVKLSDHTGV